MIQTTDQTYVRNRRIVDLGGPTSSTQQGGSGATAACTETKCEQRRCDRGPTRKYI